MTTVEKIIKIASGEVGEFESPANSNRVKYNTWYYGREVSGDAYPWNMTFVHWCFSRAGITLPGSAASCEELMQEAMNLGQWVRRDYRSSDVVFFDFDFDGIPEHCGIVEFTYPGGVRTIEGDTSISGSRNNRGVVCKKDWETFMILGAFRPAFFDMIPIKSSVGR